MMQAKCVRVIHRGASGIWIEYAIISDTKLSICRVTDEHEKVIMIRVREEKGEYSMINIT
jgi:hypothetical protein